MAEMPDPLFQEPAGQGAQEGQQQVHAMLKYMYDAPTKEKASAKQPVNIAKPEGMAVSM